MGHKFKRGVEGGGNSEVPEKKPVRVILNPVGTHGASCGEKGDPKKNHSQKLPTQRAFYQDAQEKPKKQ